MGCHPGSVLHAHLSSYWNAWSCPLSGLVLGTVEASRSTPQRATQRTQTMQATTTSTSAASTCHGTRRAASFHRRECVRQLAEVAASIIGGDLQGVRVVSEDAPTLADAVRKAAEGLQRAGRAVAVHTLDRAECRRLKVPAGTQAPAIYVHAAAGSDVEWSDCWDDGDCLHIRAFGMWAEVHHTAAAAA